MALRHHWEEAKGILSFCLQSKKDSNGMKYPKYSLDKYENLFQLYLFHVLSPLNQWDEAFQILKEEEFLSPSKKQVFYFFSFPNKWQFFTNHLSKMKRLYEFTR